MTLGSEVWSRLPQSLAFLVLGACLTLSPAPAAAQPAPDDGTRAAARELAEQGIDAYQAGDYADANRKLEKAYRLFATPTLGLWSARARMQLGQWVEAAERYREALRASAAVGDSGTQLQAQKDANEELTALSTRIPAITLELENADATGVTLRLDDAVISTELLGVRRPMNPGVHRIVASRGAERAEAEVKLAEKEHKRVPLRLAPQPAAAPLPAQVAAPAVSPVAPAAVSSAPVLPLTAAADQPGPRDSAANPVRPLAIAAIALGGASLAAAGVTALLAQGQCSGGRCTSESKQSAYDPLRTASSVTFWAGAALAAGGVVAWLAAPGLGSAEKTEALSWGVTPFGVNVRGTL